MSKASEWAAKMRKADEVKGFTWERIQRIERERPVFTVRKPDGYTRQLIATVTDDEMLALDDYWIPKDRAVAFARWILDTFGDEAR